MTVLYSIALWENPYIGMFKTIILFNATVDIFSQSYAVILSMIHLLFHYFLLLGSLLHFKNSFSFIPYAIIAITVL